MLEKLMQKFKELYGENGELRTYFAPGRVNLIGEHTDYNGGDKSNIHHSYLAKSEDVL